MYELLYDLHQKGYRLYPAKKLMPSIAELINSPLDQTGCGLQMLSWLVIEDVQIVV